MNGLVLMGGKSTRMGRDKAQIIYREIPQWQLCYKLLSEFCSHVYWSCTPEQKQNLQLGDAGLIDTFPNIGPAGGLLTAFSKHREPWLVLACDFPFCDRDVVSTLVDARNPLHCATAYLNEDNLPEPFFCIWEIAAQEKLLDLSRVGNFSPRFALSQSNFKGLLPSQKTYLENANTPQSYVLTY